MEFKIVKACVYKDSKGNFFPVVFQADPNGYVDSLGRVRMSIDGRPVTDGVRIVPMGRTPIKGIIDHMTLTDFEVILAKFDCHFHCVIPHREMDSCADVYDAFRWMMYGMNHFGNGNEYSEIILPEYKPYESAFRRVIKEQVNAGRKLTATALYMYANGGTPADARKAVEQIAEET